MPSSLRSASRPLAALLGALALCCATLTGAAPPKKSAPSWAELSASQKEILAPLAGEWDKLDTANRQRWLGVAKRYPKMTPIGKKRVQTRMRKWAALTPEQREQARQNYRDMRKHSRNKDKDLSKEWLEYERSLGRSSTTAPPASPAPAAAGQQ
jgi:hypothetical protein